MPERNEPRRRDARATRAARRAGKLRAVEATEARARALLVWRAIEDALYDPATGLFGERLGVLRRHAPLWPFAGAWSALCALASLEAPGVGRSRLERQREALERYRRPGDPHGGLSSVVVGPLGRGGERYYDDNAWIGLALCRQSRLTGDRSALAQAGELAGYLASGWLDAPGVARPGGIRWKEGRAPGSRNACANGPTAELAATLVLEGADDALLGLAARVSGWTRAALRTPEGLYADRIAPNGTVTRALLSYNQGTMVGAGALLHQATGEARFLDDALTTARASLARYRQIAALRREPPAFAAVYLRRLLYLDTIRPDAAYRALAEAYAEQLVGEVGGDGLIRRRSRHASALLSSAALVEVLALLAGADPRP